MAVADRERRTVDPSGEEAAGSDDRKTSGDPEAERRKAG